MKARVSQVQGQDLPLKKKEEKRNPERETDRERQREGR
jgi:hypothetical protein